MSSLIVSSKCVEIENNNYGIVTIKNAKTSASAESLPILFKVKTNLKELVDVRPSFGVLWPQSDRATAALNVKYTGLGQQIDKAKLMISWISTEDRSEYENKKLSHEQFNDLFKTAKKANEGSLLLPIVYKESAEKLRSQLNQSEEVQSRSNEETAPLDTQPQRFKPLQQTRAQSIQSKQSKLVAESPRQPVKAAKTSEQPRKQGYSLSVVGLAFIIAFILGVSVGIKIERYVQPYINELQARVNEYVERFTAQATATTSQNPEQSINPPETGQKVQQQPKLEGIPVIVQATGTASEENFSEQIEIIDN